MKEGILYTGVPSEEELKACPGIPSQDRMERGRVAVIECVQQIPCNPCEAACKFGAIHVGEQITNLPCLEEDRCTGCGMCVARCPGLAIVIVNRAYSPTEATIDFPFEYLPCPEVGDSVEAVDRIGQYVCQGRVLKVIQAGAYAGTCVLSIAVDKQYADRVRSIKRLSVSDTRQEE
jgi:Fe-S-cluster-containing hydrogenase component 2